MSKFLLYMGALLSSCLATSHAAAESLQTWELWVARPSRPGLLTSCPLPKGMPWPSRAATVPVVAPLRLDQPLTITWQGGQLEQSNREGGTVAPAGNLWSPFDSCFVLAVRGVVVAAGAVVPRYSARLLRSDTLVLQSDRLDQPLAFSLLPAFPAEIGQSVRPEWRQVLMPLSKPTGAASR